MTKTSVGIRIIGVGFTAADDNAADNNEISRRDLPRSWRSCGGRPDDNNIDDAAERTDFERVLDERVHKPPIPYGCIPAD